MQFVKEINAVDQPAKKYRLKKKKKNTEQQQEQIKNNILFINVYIKID